MTRQAPDENQMITLIDDMIGTAAGRLAINIDAGYTDGYECVLADEVYRRIPEDRRGEILRWLVESVVSGITVGEINMLDETSEDTYALNAEITGKLVAAIVAQDHADRTLVHLIAHEICEREDIDRTLRRAA